MGSADYKAFYFTSLINQLGEERELIERVEKARPHTAIPHTHTPKPKKYALNLQADKLKRINLAIDPAFLKREQEGRKSLRVASQTEQNRARNVQLFKKETSRALLELRNSQQHMKKALQRIQDRKLEIAKSQEQEELLIQAQCRYNKLPLLETKRACTACSMRPKSAKAGTEVTVEGVRKTGRSTPNLHRLTFSSYEKRVLAPTPSLKNQPKDPETSTSEQSMGVIDSIPRSSVSSPSGSDLEDLESTPLIGKKITFFKLS